MIDVCELDLTEKPLVSVWCLTYNFAPYIAKALDSFLEQKTDFAFEILVHDDCSTDETVGILREYQARYPQKIRLLLEEVNQGTKHLHRFLDRIRGDWVAICEGDDYWCDAHKLQRQMDFLRAHPKYSMAFHACRIEEAGQIVEEFIPYKRPKTVPIRDVIVVGGWLCPSASCVFKTEHLHRLPEYYLAADVADYPMQIYMATCGKVYYTPDIMSVYRRGHAGSWSTNLAASWNNRLAQWQREKQWMDLFNRTTKYQYCLLVWARECKCRLVLLRDRWRARKS